MDVADHALAGRDAVRKRCSIGWPDSSLGMVGSGLPPAVPRLPNLAYGPRMDRRTVIGIEHVAGRAAAGAIVAGMIVGAEEIERRIEQSRFLQTDEHRVSAVLGAEAASR